MQEPYATLALLLASVGCRGEEAVGLQPGDLDAANVLHFRRVIYGGKAEPLEKEQRIPLDTVTHADLIRRLRLLGRAGMDISGQVPGRHSMFSTMGASVTCTPPRKQLV